MSHIGSSNIDANVSVGSIFGIYKKKSEGKSGDESDCLQKGRYVLNGDSTLNMKPCISVSH